MERETLDKDEEINLRILCYYMCNNITEENVKLSIDGANIKVNNTMHFDIF